jgi:hypothetical protein
MPDCDKPKCHEHFIVELNRRPTWLDMKNYCFKALPGWVTSALVVAIMALLANGFLVWKNESSFATKSEFYANLNSFKIYTQDCNAKTDAKIARMELVDEYMAKAIDKFEKTQNEMFKYLKHNIGATP